MNAVTEHSHPTLYRALDMVSHDMGIGAGWTSYPIPDHWWTLADLIEPALFELSETDLKTFCIGDDTEMSAIAARSITLQVASVMLDQFASDHDYWPHPYQCAG